MTRSLSTLLFCLLAFSLSAQRYLTEVFTNVDVSSAVQYGQATSVIGFNVNLAMDIYEPQGDTQTERPLMVLAHGGSFVTGDRSDAYMVAICEEFARKGYVTASITYRLGINLNNLNEVDKELVKASIRAIQDHRAAVRFFYESARDNGNPYGIDTNRIIAGGLSAGAIAANHAQLFWDESTASTDVQQLIAEVGGINGGNNGSIGYPTRAIGLFNIVGAILDTQMVNSPDVATISFHGTADNVVPYDRGFATFNGQPIVQMDGSSVISQRLQNMGATYEMHTFNGVDHGILNDPVRADTIMARATRFFYREVVNNPAVGQDEWMVDGFSLYPNPASDFLHLEVLQKESCAVIDMLGKTALEVELRAGTNHLDISALRPGLYLVRIGTTVSRLVVE